MKVAWKKPRIQRYEINHVTDQRGLNYCRNEEEFNKLSIQPIISPKAYRYTIANFPDEVITYNIIHFS